MAGMEFPPFVSHHRCASSPPNMMTHMALDWWQWSMVSDEGKKSLFHQLLKIGCVEIDPLDFIWSLIEARHIFNESVEPVFTSKLFCFQFLHSDLIFFTSSNIDHFKQLGKICDPFLRYLSDRIPSKVRPDTRPHTSLESDRVLDRIWFPGYLICRFMTTIYAKVYWDSSWQWYCSTV